MFKMFDKNQKLLQIAETPKEATVKLMELLLRDELEELIIIREGSLFAESRHCLNCGEPIAISERSDKKFCDNDRKCYQKYYYHKKTKVDRQLKNLSESV